MSDIVGTGRGARQRFSADEQPSGGTDGAKIAENQADRSVNINQATVEAALASLRSSSDGLTSGEAARRLATFGLNRIQRPRGVPIAVRFAREFTHLFALTLWVAAALAFVAEISDPGRGMRPLAIAIVAVIVVNGLFSFWQEYRAEKAFRALQQLLPQEVTAVREGRSVRLPAELLVPGDVILLEAGDSIPADCRVIQAFGLRVNISTVTGESQPVARDAKAAPEGELLHSRNALLAGTAVVSGNTRALVLATGMRTEFGRIANLAQATDALPSPLQRELASLSRVIAALAVAAGVLVFSIGEALGVSRPANFLFAIGIIVANVPEGLLPTLTLALAMAARRMARRKVLVRRLSSVETLGAATVICTDKTGTLTEGRMVVRSLWAHGQLVEPSALERVPRPEVLRLLEAARRCHDLKPSGAGAAAWLGDPMEIALVEVAARHVPTDLPRLDEIPFDSDRKRLVTVHRTADAAVVYTKGALETVLPACRWVTTAEGTVPLRPQDLDAVAQAESAMAEKGLRVLSFAHRFLPEDYHPARIEEDLVLDGLIGLEDPPRPEVANAVSRCRRAGIRVVMVTGDHPQTAAAIGREIGLYGRDAPLTFTGDQVGRLSDEQLWAALEARDILFARVGADHKLRIVQALQRHRAVVAATGDGVNDAPALRAADIGIAMGVTGTDVARQAADMVLLDDNFASIVSAIEEGRAVYDNIRKFLTYILTSNVPELIPYVAFAFLGMPLALTIVQILAVDLGTDIVPALALGAEKPEAGIMDRPPRSRHSRVLTKGLLVRAYAFLGGMEATAAMTSFVVLSGQAGYVAGTTACLASIVVMQVVNVHLCRSPVTSVFTSIRRRNPLIVAGIVTELIVILAIVYTPPGNAIFATAPLEASAWLFMMPFAVGMLVAEEGRKQIVRTLRRRRHMSPQGVPAADGSR